MKQIGYVTMELDEIHYSVVEWNLYQEDLDRYDCKTKEEFISKVRLGLIDMFELDWCDWETVDTDIAETRPESAKVHEFTRN